MYIATWYPSPVTSLITLLWSSFDHQFLCIQFLCIPCKQIGPKWFQIVQAYPPPKESRSLIWFGKVSVQACPTLEWVEQKLWDARFPGIFPTSFASNRLHFLISTMFLFHMQSSVKEWSHLSPHHPVLFSLSYKNSSLEVVREVLFGPYLMVKVADW